MRKMLFSIVGLVVFPTLLMPVITLKRYEAILEQKVVAASQAKLVQIKKNLESMVNAMVAASNVLVLDTELTNILAEPNPSSYYDYYFQKKSKIEEKISGVLNASLYPYDASITIIDFQGNVYDSHPNVPGPNYSLISNEAWFKDTVALNGFVLWVAPTHGTIDLGSIDPGVVALARTIKARNGTRNYGVLLVTINRDPAFDSIFAKGQSDQPGRVFLLNERNSIVAAAAADGSDGADPAIAADLARLPRSASGSETVVASGGRVVINFASIEKTGWKVAEAIPFNRLTADIRLLRLNSLAVNALFVLGLALVSFFISWGITRPVHRLSEAMANLSRGDFDIRVRVPGGGELRTLAESFNQMAAEIEVLVDDVERESRLRVESRLLALQAQVNPHFLFNSLNGIKWMAAMGKVEQIPEMISSLGNLLETALDNSREMISLDEERHCVEDYVKIQRMRFGDRFLVRFEIPPDLREAKVPCLILQPLVENAIIHGFDGIDRRGEIVIRCEPSAHAGEVTISVSDNGVGIDPDKLNGLISERPETASRFRHIGLRNVHERLQLQFGKETGLCIDRRRTGGTTVSFSVPAALSSATEEGRESWST